MMILITGKQDSGKTTRLLTHYQNHLQGDGFALLKQMRGHDVLGFAAMRLTSGETHPFLTHQKEGIAIEHAMKIGPYLVDEDMYQKMIETFEAMIDQRIQPIYIDEIGRWELSGQGFDSIIKKSLQASLDLVCTVRDEFIDQVIKRYHIEGNYTTL